LKEFLKKYGNRFYAGMTFKDFAAEVCRIPDSETDPNFRSHIIAWRQTGNFCQTFLADLRTSKRILRKSAG